MDDIELRSVQLHNPVSRTGSLTAVTDLRRVQTDKGDLLVAVQGDTSKPAILTYHDLGLNCKSNKFFYPHFSLHHFPFLHPRCHKFRWLLQLPIHARTFGKLLCLSCECSWTRRKCLDISRRVSLFIVCFKPPTILLLSLTHLTVSSIQHLMS